MVFTDSDRRLIQVRMGGAPEKQDGQRRGGHLRTYFTDKGKEFYNATFAKMLERYGIPHFSMQGDAKASVVERFNRTLKGRMYRYFTAQGTQDYVLVRR